MPISCADLLKRVGDVLQDVEHVRWEVSELLMWINDAARETILRRPAARAVPLVAVLLPGTRQELPERGVELLDVVRNVTVYVAPPPKPPSDPFPPADPSEPTDPVPPVDPMRARARVLADEPVYLPGRAVTRVERKLLDRQEPDWHSKKPTKQVRHFSFDERSPRVFYVYPPVLAGTCIEVLQSELPPAVVEDGDMLDMGAEYINVIVAYTCFRAFAKDSEFANGTVAAAHYQAFVDAVQADNETATTNSPNANKP